LPLDLSVELGRTRMTVHELLQLGQGSVIELNRMASDLIDLTVNGRVIAHGEAVVVNESFGFRVAEVDSLRDRIKKL
jgi:flagellar motor switch protein FliN/FliY